MEVKFKFLKFKRDRKIICLCNQKYVLLILLLMFSFDGFAQIPDSGYSIQKPLSDVLDEFSNYRKVRFAFDPVALNKIHVDPSIANTSTEVFLEHLKNNYGVESKLIDGTWLLIVKQIPGTASGKDTTLNEWLVTGYVKDATTGEPIQYSNVATKGFSGGTTNELGFFNFHVQHTDSVQLKISHLGYKGLDTIVQVNRPNMIFLKPAVIMMETIKVVHHEKDVLQASSSPVKIAFNPAKASAIPRIANDDMGNALLLIPGIVFREGSLSGLSIRGGEPTDNLVLLDGIPVLETSHLLGNMSVLNAKFIKQAFVSRGGFDASHGGNVSGVIELIGRTGRKNEPYFDFSANLLNTNLLTSFPVTRNFSVTAAWRRSYIDTWQNYMYNRIIDNVNSAEENQVTSTILPVVKFQDVNTKLSFHPSENFNADFNILYGSDIQSRDFEILRTKDYYRNELLHSKTIGASLNINWQLNPKTFHTFSLGFSNLERNETDETGELNTVTETITNPSNSNGKGNGLAKSRYKTYIRETHDIDNGLNQVEEFRVKWKTQFRTGLFINEAGIGWTSNWYDYRYYASTLNKTLFIDSISNSTQMNFLNAYVQQHIGLDNRLRFRWGLRANYILSQNKMKLQPRVGIEFVPEKEFKAYLLTGVYFQFLSGIRRFDSDGNFSRIWYLPDQTDMGVVSGIHYIGGMKYEKNGWFIDLEAYHKQTKGKVNLFAQTFQHTNSQVVVYELKENQEKHRGIDFFLQKKHSLFNHMVGYSISRSDDKMSGFFKDDWFPGYNDRTHRLMLTEMINWRSWIFTGTWQFGSGLPIYSFIPGQEIENLVRSDNFSQLNFTLVKNFKYSNISLSTGASLLNVCNKANIVEVNYLRFSSESESMTVRSDISALGFTPVFYLEVKF